MEITVEECRSCKKDWTNCVACPVMMQWVKKDPRNFCDYPKRTIMDRMMLKKIRQIVANNDEMIGRLVREVIVDENLD